ncbi:MAG: dephospho-CoA kinase [Gammaproteobacteria bacterium]|nr:dephospho-CoA kinase [Gammaproteobacteria bacterium]MDE2345475.1 dephospho-CoA kinase [Gammaproteobacteria bacterium]
MLKVGLTGGVASGKSTVAAEFSRLGVPVVDADALARKLTSTGSPALSQLTAVLGPEILDEHGRLDRKRLRQRLFTDAGIKAKVEAVLHPLVIRELKAGLESSHGAYAIAVIPLLAEHPETRALVDRVLVVDCPESQQMARLMLRDGENTESARAMLAAQAGRKQRLAAGDDILGNVGGLAQLRESVRRLHAHYLKIARHPAQQYPGIRLP